MENVIFVHGIGVRQPAYEKSFGKIKKNLIDRLGGSVSVHECYWGGSEGAKLHIGGASVPPDEKKSTRALPQSSSDEEYELTLWEILYQDPFYELRLYISQQQKVAEISPGKKPEGREILKKLESFTILDQAIAEAELEKVFDRARLEVINMPDLRVVAGKISKGEAPSFREVLARAIVAKAIDLYGEDSGLCEAATNALVRDELVNQIIQGTGQKSRAAEDHWPVKQIIGSILSKLNDRVRSQGYAAPGDVLLYQARGQGIRDFIANHIKAVNKPIIIIAHSLGGVASVDLLMKQNMGVDLLITVGSQAPLFYELNALQSLSFDEGGRNPQLPEHFPKWLNFYDKRDFLSYVGGKIFKGPIEDVEVNNKQPFYHSHLSYWSNGEMWEKIVGVIGTLKD